MRNPLVKRYPRELRHNLGKYLGLFFMMAFATAFTSGFLLSADSIKVMLNDMDETYHIEDGHFACDFEADDEAIDAVEALGVTVYEDFSKQVDLDLGGSGDGTDDVTARVTANRTEIDLPSYAEGRVPEAEGEVALDRVFMANHGLFVGDAVMLDGREFTIVGICTLPDYQALFESNGDFVFNAISFTIAQVTPEAMRSLDNAGEVFNYAFTFDDPMLDRAQRTGVEEDMIDALVDNGASVSDFVDAEDNQGIGFALDDVEGDSTMWTVLLFMLVVIMAFVFVVLTGATIEQESAVIGTLLASGWRKRDLVRHYLALPAIIAGVAVSVGLVVGVTVLSGPFQGLYYNSYSLPPFERRWNMGVVALTTIVPFLLLVGITLMGLLRKMKFTPLQFLRHEVVSRKRNASLRLPDGLRYTTRFRLRVLLRNASHFVTLFFGIMFASLLLLFGTCMLPVVQNYADDLRETVAAPYEYVLKAPVELEGTEDEREMYAAALRLVEDRDRIDANRDAIDAAERLEDQEGLMDALERLVDGEVDFSDVSMLLTLDDADIDDINLAMEMDDDLMDDVRLVADIDEDAHVVNTQENSEEAVAQAERYAVATVEIERLWGGKMESVTVYGIQFGSRYWADVPVADGHVVAGRGTVEKTKAEVGGSVTLQNRREGKTYEVIVADETSNEADVSLYMTLDDFNRLFGEDADYFNAYASAQELAIDGRYVASVVAPADMDKISEQLGDSMGDITRMIILMAVPIYLILVYLLTKTVIDRSARSISYMKVFGYHAGEVSGLYVRPMTYWVLFSLVASLPIIMGLLMALLKVVFMDYTGNFAITVPPSRFVMLVAVGMATYALVAFLHMRRIHNVPLELAMKVQE